MDFLSLEVDQFFEMIFSTTKYLSIILHSISHKTVEAANYFGHYLSLETVLKTAYFLTKKTRVLTIFSDFSIQNHRNAHRFLKKLSKIGNI